MISAKITEVMGSRLMKSILFIAVFMVFIINYYYLTGEIHKSYGILLANISFVIASIIIIIGKVYFKYKSIHQSTLNKTIDYSYPFLIPYGYKVFKYFISKRISMRNLLIISSVTCLIYAFFNANKQGKC